MRQRRISVRKRAGARMSWSTRVVNILTIGWSLWTSDAFFGSWLGHMNYSKQPEWRSLVSTPCIDILSQYWPRLSAILQALAKCRRLHGDISINNILITRKNGVFVAGILIDWEFSCIFDKERRNYNRSVSTFALEPRPCLIVALGHMGLHVYQRLAQSYYSQAWASWRYGISILRGLLLCYSLVTT